ncbi:DUF5719 family protein [Nocardiopsis sp. NPDC058631]|uniref:DUF5719 family protein n=1 Tax=Nocardiopsis sp. NPDC058631 TaxID=3346566 RepID=UPI00364BB4E6
MRLIVENRFALFGLVALALAALFGVAFVTRPVTAELGVTEPGSVRPDHAVRVCPAPHEQGDSTVAAFSPRVSRDDEGGLWAELVPAAPQQDEDAEDAEDTSGADGEDTEDADGTDARETGDGPGEADRERVGDELTEPGRVWTADASDADAPAALRAEGALASGLDAAQTTLSDGSVTEVRCVEPSIGTWFALPGAGGGEAVAVEALTVRLANPEDSRATVSVDVYTEGGPSYSSESRGISLLAGESTELDLTELVLSSGAVGVQVRTSTGRVAASLLAEHASGGADWVPPTAAPAEHHVVPGVVGADGRRHLVLAAPGDEPAEVRVHAVATPPEDGGEEAEESGAAGSGTAEDPLVVTVPPAAASWVTLESILGGEAAAVVVESDVPVVAGVAAEAMDGDDVVETAYTAAVPPLGPPLDATAIVPDVPEGTSTELILSAVEGDASLMATPVAADGTQGDAVRVGVEGGTTVVFGADEDPWQVPPGADPEDGYAVRLELVDGTSLHVARVLRDGDGLSVLPVRPAPVEIPLPVVRDSMVGVVP